MFFVQNIYIAMNSDSCCFYHSVINYFAGSCDNDSTSEWQENQRRLVGMLDELCELIACAEATVLATEGSPPDNDKETLEAQVAECEV